MTAGARPVVVYTDPAWALGPAGEVEPARATIERAVLGDGVDLRFGVARDGRYRLDDAAHLAALAGARVLAITRYAITEPVLAAAGAGLGLVVRLGVGVDNLNAPLLERHGVMGLHVPDYCVDEVASHTVALVLALERHVVVQHRTLAGGVFDVYAGGVPRRLQRCTAGLVGFGRIGRAVAARLRPFYGRLLACDPYVADDVVEAHGARRVGLAELLAAADVVSLHCELTAETRGMMDAAAFARMKPGALLVNAARGALVQSGALYEALAAGRLGGAGLDVFVPEDPHGDPDYRKLLQLDGVVATCHRAFLSAEAEASQRRRAADNIRRFLAGGDVDAP
ncbi:MAG TPA: NAD(P)-dependent oxidoreductase, partial [Methylomirabilota bacterium]|nr:NAD(P)-dependent oxidoreductase [Methylomirabilota bacterium]